MTRMHTILAWVLGVTLLQAVTGQVLVHASGGGDTDRIQRVEVVIQNREVIADGNVIRVTRGDRVELVWSSDESVSLHLHGYDIEFRVEPGTPEVLSFTAHATGRFPITSHGFGDRHVHGHDTLMYLEVYPR